MVVDNACHIRRMLDLYFEV